MNLESINIKEGTRIEYTSPELLFLARSGQPYRGSLYVSFTSLGESFDTQDFKHYITSLRSCTLNAEDIAYEIFSKIEMSIKSKNLGVVVDLTARGGLQQRLSYGHEFQVVEKNSIFQVIK